MDFGRRRCLRRRRASEDFGHGFSSGRLPAGGRRTVYADVVDVLGGDSGILDSVPHGLDSTLSPSGVGAVAVCASAQPHHR